MNGALVRMLSRMGELGASDCHLSVGSKPRFRVHGKLIAGESEPVTLEQMEEFFAEVLMPAQHAALEENGEVDLVHGGANGSRFRTNLFRETAGYSAVFRRLPAEAPTLESLGLPAIVAEFPEFQSGLLLVAGPTGSGSTTTLHALLEHANERAGRHIVTIENPIEFVHRDKRSTFHQRQVGLHVKNAEAGIQRALLMSPDVIAVDPLDGAAAVTAACAAAEAGVLVIATIRCNGVLAALERVIELLVAPEPASARHRLSYCLRAIIAQHRLRRLFGTGSIVVPEILLNTASVALAIREDRPLDVVGGMRRGRGLGMCTLDESLRDALDQKMITPEDAYAVAEDKVRFEAFFRAGALSRRK